MFLDSRIGKWPLGPILSPREPPPRAGAGLDSPEPDASQSRRALPGEAGKARRPPAPPHPTAEIIPKIGRYIATITPPTTTPSTTIMTGSTMAITASSAVSTSCS